MKNWIASMETKIDALGAKLEKKEIQYPVDLTAGVLCLVASIVLLLILPTQYHAQPDEVMDGGTFPRLMIYVMMAMSAFLVVKELVLIAQKKPLVKKTLNLWVEVKALFIFLLIFVAYLLCKVTDLFVVGCIFLAVAFPMYFRCKKPLYYAITVAMAVAIWAVFRFVLGVQF